MTADLGSRPRAATRRGSLLRAELGRLRHRRFVLLLLGLAALALLVSMAAVFFTHSKDLAGARAQAVAQAEQATREQQRFLPQCLQDPTIPPESREQACGVGFTPTPEEFYNDPRLRADAGLPVIAIAIAVGGAFVAALVGATAVGADWASRAIVTLLTWEPRRVRLLGTRFAALALFTAAVAVVGQAVGLGLGALTVTLRGTWAGTPGPTDGAPYQQPALIGAADFWRDLLSLQGRGVALMVTAAVLAAAVTSLTRHTGGMLGAAFAWFAVVENAVRIAFGQRGWGRWLISENVVAFLNPGGLQVPAGRAVGRDGQIAERTVLVSNLDALAYLGGLTAVCVVIAVVLLRRRDL